jgi:hypothetical protein
MPGAGRNVDVDTALAELTERLVKRFAGEVPREVVEETVTACAVRFRDARVVDFVPLLTERLCVRRLHDLADGAAPSDATSGARRVS